LRLALSGALTAAGCSSAEVAATCLALAGVNEPENEPQIAAMIAPLSLGGPVRIVRDLVAADVAATRGGPGVTVITGTGVAVLARGASGELTGPQDLLLPASAGGLGIAAVQHALAQSLCHQADSLTQSILAHLGCRNAAGLMAWAAARPNRFPGSFFKYAALAPVVDLAAQNGDPAARNILGAAGSGLAMVIAGLAAAVGLDHQTVPVGLVGSVIERSQVLRQAFITSLWAIAPDLQPGPPQLSPVAAAVALAMQADGLAWTAELWERLGAWGSG
jgi:N-acetylglucosamine kinase-like BadF-type ATPase